MNREQAVQIYRELFVAFPHMHDALNRAESPDETFEAWCKMLVDVNCESAQVAIGKWKSGSLEPPEKPWEVSLLPLKIKAVAGTIEMRKAKQDRQEALHRETIARNTARPRGNFAELMRVAMRAGHLHRDGLISDAENKSIVRDLQSQLSQNNTSVEVPIAVQRLWRANVA